ncbi:putative phosphohydrolase [Vibrio phage VCPH]|nr:putative phosphohydrolase [Vibrio phage VCPH]
MKQAAIAKSIAATFHAGQRYGGYDYHSYHLAGVVAIIEELWPESPKLDILKAAGWLHDALEDTEADVDTLLLFVHPEVIAAVELVTKDPAVGYSDYLRQIAAHNIAYKVKVADTMFNLRQNVKEGNLAGIRKYSRQIERLAKYRDAHKAFKDQHIKDLTKSLQEQLREEVTPSFNCISIGYRL